MPLERQVFGLVGALVAALLVQVPMFPGTGLETRDLSTFAPWFQGVSMIVFPSLMVAAVVAVVRAKKHPWFSAVLALAFATGMIAVTLLDLSGLGGTVPPTAIASLESAALATLAVTFVFAVLVLLGSSRVPAPVRPRPPAAPD